MSRDVGRVHSPRAQRAPNTGWRDPRLWIGVAIVAASVVVGARVIGAADDSVAVWAVTDDMATGDTVTTEDLVSRRVGFVDAADAARYLPADESLPADPHLTRGVGAGELLPRDALGTAAESGVVEVPLAVADGRVPASVGAGSVVDVWVADATPGTPGRGARARKVLEGVVVIEAPRVTDGFGATGDRQLVVGVPRDQAAALPPALGAAVAGSVVVTRQG